MMLTNFKELRDQIVYCQDGVCGRVFDVFFDDRNGKIQHVVVRMGSWLRPRRVLLSPSQLKQSSDGALVVDLRLDQMRYLSHPDTNPPVSRQQFLLSRGLLAAENHETPNSAGPIQAENDRGVSNSSEVTVFDILLRNRRQEQSKGHLRSVREVSGYEVEIECGRAGTMADVWLNTATWQVTHLSLQLQSQKKRIAVPATLIRGISWSSGTIRLSANWEQSAEGPCLTPTESVESRPAVVQARPRTNRLSMGVL